MVNLIWTQDPNDLFNKFPHEKGSIFLLYLEHLIGGGAAAKVESVLLSPAASFFPKEQIARGRSSVRLLRDDLEMNGEQWTYDHTAKKVSIAQGGRVSFAAQMPDLLK